MPQTQSRTIFHLMQSGLVSTCLTSKSIDANSIVTGCSSGIGESLAKLIAQSPNRLVATARNPASLSHNGVVKNIIWIIIGTPHKPGPATIVLSVRPDWPMQTLHVLF